MKSLAKKLEKLCALKEIKTRQRSRDMNILGHMNTSYFHAVPNKRFRKKMIEFLIRPEGPIHDTQKILKIASDFNKDLFKWESRGHFTLDSKFWNVENMVTSEERIALEAPFMEEEIKEAVFSSYPRPFLFYQKFWEVVIFVKCLKIFSVVN
jgi:hypothetical protein